MDATDHPHMNEGPKKYGRNGGGSSSNTIHKTSDSSKGKKKNSNEDILKAIEEAKIARLYVVSENGLMDSEINNVISGRLQVIEKRKNEVKRRKKTETSAVPRKPFDSDCPICFEEVTNSNNTVYCKGGCGNNIHRKCMVLWSDQSRSEGKKVTCPLCRIMWSEKDLHSLRFTVKSAKKKTPTSVIHEGVPCANCQRASIVGLRYKCTRCYNFNLCERCFCQIPIHVHHPFVVTSFAPKDIVSDFCWEQADRPLAPLVIDSTGQNNTNIDPSDLLSYNSLSSSKNTGVSINANGQGKIMKSQLVSASQGRSASASIHSDIVYLGGLQVVGIGKKLQIRREGEP